MFVVFKANRKSDEMAYFRILRSLKAHQRFFLSFIISQKLAKTQSAAKPDKGLK